MDESFWERGGKASKDDEFGTNAGKEWACAENKRPYAEGSTHADLIIISVYNF